MHKIDIKFKPSPTYQILLMLFLLASVGMIIATTLAWYLKILCCLLIAGYGGFGYKRYAALTSLESIQGLHCVEKNHWQVYQQTKSVSASLCGDSTVTTLVSVLKFRILEERKVRSCIIFPDSLPKGEYKQLIAFLKTSY